MSYSYTCVLDEAPTDWFAVGCREDVLAGRRIRVLAGEHDVAIFCVEGEVFAIGNRCAHAGAPLSEGYLDGEAVSVPSTRGDSACAPAPQRSSPVSPSKRTRFASTTARSCCTWDRREEIPKEARKPGEEKKSRRGIHSRLTNRFDKMERQHFPSCPNILFLVSCGRFLLGRVHP